jgi:hypothetical protein
VSRPNHQVVHRFIADDGIPLEVMADGSTRIQSYGPEMSPEARQTRLRSHVLETHPHLRSSGPLNRSLSTQWSDADYAAIERIAEQRGISKSEAGKVFMRSDGATPVPPFRETAFHLMRSSFPLAPGASESEEWLLRAVADTGTTDTTGLLGTYVDGRFVAFIDARRPAMESANGGVGPLPMSAKGKTFTRPRVTSFPTSAAQTEKSQLSSTQLTTASDALTKTAHGSVLNLTEQDVDWGDESCLDGTKETLAEAYAIDTEATFTAAIEAKVTTNVVGGSVDVTSVDDFVGAVGAAQLAVAGTAGIPGDTVYVGINQLANATAMVGNVTFPELFPRIVYSPGFSDNFIAVGASRFLEVFEAVKGFVAQTGALGAATMYGDTPASPATLERALAFRGYLVTNAYAQALCGIVAS